MLNKVGKGVDNGLLINLFLITSIMSQKGIGSIMPITLSTCASDKKKFKHLSILEDVWASV